jgi:hypothetical protein
VSGSEGQCRAQVAVSLGGENRLEALVQFLVRDMPVDERLLQTLHGDAAIVLGNP